jgi:hypothetical protein
MKFSLSDRDYALFVLDELDLEAQLLAIRGTLSRQRQANKKQTEDIQELEQKIKTAVGEDSRHFEDAWLDRLHGSVFQDAAHSMSAVGMLAPLVESLFVAIFQGLRERQKENGSNLEPSERRVRNQCEYWDPHFVYDKNGRQRDFRRGVTQLAVSIGLELYLPDNYPLVLDALFSYRNKMFHHGFEWPTKERQAFDKQWINNVSCKMWFQKSVRNYDPWIFYMTRDFEMVIIETIELILDGVGKYVRAGKGELG